MQKLWIYFYYIFISGSSIQKYQVEINGLPCVNYTWQEWIEQQCSKNAILSGNTRKYGQQEIMWEMCEKAKMVVDKVRCIRRFRIA